MEIDADKLKETAASRKNQRVIDWRCHFCGKSFTSEKLWMDHDNKCQIKQRLTELRSPLGQAAYQYYVEWMKQYKRRPPAAETFSDSRYYKSFIQYAEHVNRVSLADPTLFIRIMVENDISPMLWRRDQCYTMYLQHFDQKLDPLDQVTISVETLLNINEKQFNNEDLSTIYERLGIRQIIELIKLRKLSPWLLFCSSTFGPFLRNADENDANELAKVINATYWSDVLQQNESTVFEIKKICEELNI